MYRTLGLNGYDLGMVATSSLMGIERSETVLRARESSALIGETSSYAEPLLVKAGHLPVPKQRSQLTEESEGHHDDLATG